VKCILDRGLCLIHLKNIRKCFGTAEALKGVSFTIRPGEVLGLLGHNGAGKTTTLRLIATLLDPTDGVIERPPDFKRLLGFFQDNPFLFDYLTGREMLYFMASLYKVPRETIQPRVQSFLSLLELDGRANQLIATYSRGMRRKISLAGSLLHDPSYWLLDEPTEALDPVAIRILKNLITERRLAHGAVVLSTHQLVLAEEQCDRLVILDHGRKVFEGTLAELRSYAPNHSSLEDIYIQLVGGRNRRATLQGEHK
jgi:ABC-2 type transport system ATP-binding protein